MKSENLKSQKSHFSMFDNYDFHKKRFRVTSNKLNFLFGKFHAFKSSPFRPSLYEFKKVLGHKIMRVQNLLTRLSL